jgi:uncharacterized repeat protein (TIGR03803 family)
VFNLSIDGGPGNIGWGALQGPLVQGPDGKLYDMLTGGGTNDISGSFFRISTNGDVTGDFTNLYEFYGANTYPNPPEPVGPSSGLVLGRDGNFYNTSINGGTNGVGTVFRISTNGTLANLYQFYYPGTCTNYTGDIPRGLVQGTNGCLYGVTETGGNATINGQANSNFFGTVFRISTNVNNGNFTTLYWFTGEPNGGGGPAGPLTLGLDGNFYGTTAGCKADCASTNIGGTVFRITPSGVFTQLYAFTGPAFSGGDIGILPPARLVQGSGGNLYGVTAYGGIQIPSEQHGYGTVFQISTNGVFTNLHTFTGGSDGYMPWSPLVPGSDGNFYGVTTSGGILRNSIQGSGNGTVFQIDPYGAFSTIYSFTNGLDGANPVGGLVQGSDGNLYGLTQNYAPNYWARGPVENPSGTIFRLNVTGDTRPNQISGISGVNCNVIATVRSVVGETYQLQYQNTLWKFVNATDPGASVTNSPGGPINLTLMKVASTTRSNRVQVSICGTNNYWYSDPVEYVGCDCNKWGTLYGNAYPSNAVVCAEYCELCVGTYAGCLSNTAPAYTGAAYSNCVNACKAAWH